jgi:uncharacterized HhH-GPD family protein
MALQLAQEPEADRLLTENPFALLVGMVLDQQVPMERAFAAPLELQKRLGRKLSAKGVATTEPGDLLEVFTRTHALHRFPAAMAERVQRVAQVVVEEWGGKPERIWMTATTGTELISRLEKLPGFGKQKARIFAALLGKQLGCTPTGWREASAPYGAARTKISIADITDAASFKKVREAKRAAKAAHRAAAE